MRKTHIVILFYWNKLYFFQFHIEKEYLWNFYAEYIRFSQKFPFYENFFAPEGTVSVFFLMMSPLLAQAVEHCRKHVKTATLQCSSLGKRLLESLMLLLNHDNRWMCGMAANTHLGMRTLACEEAVSCGAPCSHRSPFHCSVEDKWAGIPQSSSLHAWWSFIHLTWAHGSHTETWNSAAKLLGWGR